MNLNVEKLKQELKLVLKSSDMVLGHVTASLSRAYGLRSLLVIRRDNALVDITQYCEKILEKVQAYQEELLSVVESHSALKEENLMRRREALCAQQKALQNLYDQSSNLLKVGSDIEVSALAPGLIQHLTKLDVEKEPLLSKDDDISVLEFWPGHILARLEQDGIGEIQFKKDKATSSGGRSSSSGDSLLAKARRRCKINQQSLEMIDKHLQPRKVSAKAQDLIASDKRIKSQRLVSLTSGSTTGEPISEEQKQSGIHAGNVAKKPQTIQKVYEPQQLGKWEVVTSKKSRVDSSCQKTMAEHSAPKGVQRVHRVAGRGRARGKRVTAAGGSPRRAGRTAPNNSAAVKLEVPKQEVCEKKGQFKNSAHEAPLAATKTESSQKPIITPSELDGTRPKSPAPVKVDMQPPVSQPSLFTLGKEAKRVNPAPPPSLPSNQTYSFKPPEVKPGGRWSFIDEERKHRAELQNHFASAWSSAPSVPSFVIPARPASAPAPQTYTFCQPLYPAFAPQPFGFNVPQAMVLTGNKIQFGGQPQIAGNRFAPLQSAYAQSVSNPSLPTTVKRESPQNAWSRPHSVPNTPTELSSVMNIKQECVTPASQVKPGVSYSDALHHNSSLVKRETTPTPEKQFSEAARAFSQQTTSTPRQGEHLSSQAGPGLSDSGYPSPGMNLSNVSSKKSPHSATSPGANVLMLHRNRNPSACSQGSDSFLQDSSEGFKSESSSSIDEELRALENKFLPINKRPMPGKDVSGREREKSPSMVRPLLQKSDIGANNPFSMGSLAKALPDTSQPLMTTKSIFGKPAPHIATKELLIRPAGMIYGLSYPIGVSATDDMIIVCETGNNSVNIYPRPFFNRENPKKIMGFDRPSGVAVDSENNEFFIKDDEAITVFDLQAKKMKRQIGRGDFVKPYGVVLVKDGGGICLTGDDRVVVMDHRNLSLLSYPKAGGRCCRTPIQLPAIPSAIPGIRSMCRFFAACKDFFVISDLGQNNVYLVSKGGQVVKVFKTQNKYGRGDGEFNEPAGITVDQSGNLLIADSRNNRIQVFSQSGDFICILPLPYPIKRPSDIHLTKDGCLLICNLHDGSISVFQLEGKIPPPAPK